MPEKKVKIRGSKRREDGVGKGRTPTERAARAARALAREIKGSFIGASAYPRHASSGRALPVARERFSLPFHTRINDELVRSETDLAPTKKQGGTRGRGLRASPRACHELSPARNRRRGSLRIRSLGGGEGQGRRIGDPTDLRPAVARPSFANHAKSWFSFDGRTLRQNSSKSLLPPSVGPALPSPAAGRPRARSAAVLLHDACGLWPAAACVGLRQGDGCEVNLSRKQEGFWG